MPLPFVLLMIVCNAAVPRCIRSAEGNGNCRTGCPVRASVPTNSAQPCPPDPPCVVEVHGRRCDVRRRETTAAQKAVRAAPHRRGTRAAVGYATGQYAGLALLIPAVLALLVGWGLSTIVPVRNKPMVPASTIQVGHGFWMLLGLFLIAQLNLNLIDVFLLGVAAVWLVLAVCLAFWPSIVLVSMLVCYQAVMLAVNGLAFVAATRNTIEHKALLVHLLLRTTAIALMVYGLIEIDKRQRRAADGSASVEIPS